MPNTFLINKSYVELFSSFDCLVEHFSQTDGTVCCDIVSSSFWVQEEFFKMWLKDMQLLKTIDLWQTMQLYTNFGGVRDMISIGAMLKIMLFCYGFMMGMVIHKSSEGEHTSKAVTVSYSKPVSVSSEETTYGYSGPVYQNDETGYLNGSSRNSDGKAEAMAVSQDTLTWEDRQY